MKNMYFTLIDISKIKDYHIHSNFESVVSGVCPGSIVGPIFLNICLNHFIFFLYVASTQNFVSLTCFANTVTSDLTNRSIKIGHDKIKTVSNVKMLRMHTDNLNSNFHIKFHIIFSYLQVSHKPIKRTCLFNVLLRL